MTTVFPPLCFNFVMPNLRRRLDPSVSPVTTEAEITSRGHIRPTRSLRKNLFGTVDHEENMKFVKSELNMLAERDSRRWNFDFINEKPLEGKIKWKLTDTSKLPPAYNNMPNLTAKITQSTASTSSQSEVTKSKDILEKTIVPIEPADITSTSHIVKPLVRKAVVAPVNNQKSIIKSKSVKRKRTSQTHITDYLRSCKRTRSSESKMEEKTSQPVLKQAETSS